MRLAHQLVLGSSAAVALVMTIYGVTTLSQRERIISNALVRETETLARTMQIVASAAVRNGQTASLDRVLGRIVADPDMAVSAVLDSRGSVMAGGPRDSLDCIRPVIARAGRVSEIHAWALMGINVFLGLRFGVWGKESPAEVTRVANHLLQSGLRP